MLEQEIVRREVVCVGKNAGAKLEQLYRAERAGARDQVGGEAAGEEIAGRAGGEKQKGGEHEGDGWVAHERNWLRDQGSWIVNKTSFMQKG
jgi:hypothetical protein